MKMWYDKGMQLCTANWGNSATHHCPFLDLNTFSGLTYPCLVSDYKRKIKEAGIDAESLMIKGSLHGFFSKPGMSYSDNCCVYFVIGQYWSHDTTYQILGICKLTALCATTMISMKIQRQLSVVSLLYLYYSWYDLHKMIFANFCNPLILIL